MPTLLLLNAETPDCSDIDPMIRCLLTDNQALLKIYNYHLLLYCTKQSTFDQLHTYIQTPPGAYQQTALTLCDTTTTRTPTEHIQLLQQSAKIARQTINPIHLMHGMYPQTQGDSEHANIHQHLILSITKWCMEQRVAMIVNEPIALAPIGPEDDSALKITKLARHQWQMQQRCLTSKLPQQRRGRQHRREPHNRRERHQQRWSPQLIMETRPTNDTQPQSNNHLPEISPLPNNIVDTISEAVENTCSAWRRGLLRSYPQRHRHLTQSREEPQEPQTLFRLPEI